MPERFYTYLWLREDGTPYYVGKGIEGRAFRKGCPPKDRIIFQYWPSEQDAFTAEQFLISYYGRKDIGSGILRNFTDGGEGSVGAIRSTETKKRTSDSLRQAYIEQPRPPVRPDVKLRISKSLQGRTPVAASMASRTLTDSMVYEIRRMHRLGKTQTEISRLFGISQPYCSRLCAGTRRLEKANASRHSS
jgi:hypothetical protein